MIREVFLSLDPATSGLTLAGMTILERQIFTLARAGAESIRVRGDLGPIGRRRPTARLPQGVEVSFEPAARSPAADGGAPLFEPLPPRAGRPAAARVSGRHLFRTEEVRRLLAQASREPAPGSWVPIGSPPQRRRAMEWLLEGVRKQTDGFMAKHFDRRLSLSVTRLLLGTPVRPNHMTLASTGLGLAGAFLLLDPRHSSAVAGSLLVWLHSVLDGCDGELARLTFRESPRGRWLDFWGDNLVHVSLFACLGLGTRDAFPGAWVLGLSACAGTMASALLAWRSSRRPDAAAPPSGPLARIETALAQRDFIYLLVLAAFFDREEWFLWAAGLGAPLYGAMLLRLPLKRAADLWTGLRQGAALSRSGTDPRLAPGGALLPSGYGAPRRPSGKR